MSGLPSALNPALFAAVAALISFLLSGASSLIVLIPGFRPKDSTRTLLMRTLMYALNLVAVLVYCWVSGVVLRKGELISLLLALGGGNVFAHLLYGANGSAHSASSGSDPSAAIAALAAATQQAQAPTATTATTATTAS